MNNKEEIRLFKLVREYDKSLAASCLVSTVIKMQQVDNTIKMVDYEVVPIPGIADDCCFRIKFHLPLFVLISRDISYFRMLIEYYKLNIGFMPVYIPAINEITLLKTWNYFANNMLGPTSMIDSDYACLKFTRKTEMAELSSMNFILRNHTDFQVVDEKELVDLTVKYFQNFYWHVPKQRPNFFNIMFYHNFYKIYSIHQVSKTIFEINEIKEHEQINLGTKCFFLRRASIRRLCSLNNQYYIDIKDCYLSEDIVKTIDGKRKLLVNGLMNTVTIGRLKHQILFAPVRFLTDITDLLKAVTGMIAVERFDITGNLRVGMVSEFEKDVYRTMKLFDDHEFYDNFEQYRKTFFEKVMEDLSPALITIENNEIYFLHPVFLGLLSHLQRPDLLSKKSLLIDLIRLMNYNRHEARLSDEAENLLKAGIAKNKLLNCINLINDALNYSRILKR